MHCCPHLVCVNCTTAWLKLRNDQRAASGLATITLPCPMACMGNMAPTVVVKKKFGMPVIHCSSLLRFLRRRYDDTPRRPARQWVQMA